MKGVVITYSELNNGTVKTYCNNMYQKRSINFTVNDIFPHIQSDDNLRLHSVKKAFQTASEQSDAKNTYHNFTSWSNPVEIDGQSM